MNSRQRRKAAAKIHNMARIELAAHQEDRIRDPKKYEPSKRTRRAARLIGLIHAGMAMSCSSVTQINLDPWSK